MVVPAKYIAGVAIALCTTFMSALGLSLQKKAHKRVAKKVADSQGVNRGRSPKALREPMWLCGLGFMAASALISLAVFALVGQSVASAFASVTIVYNMILSRLFLHEAVSRFDVCIGAIMIAGTVTAVVFGSQGASSSFLTLDDIIEIWTRPAAIIGFCVFGFVLIVNAVYLFFWLDKEEEAGQLNKRGWRYRLSLFQRCLVAGLFSGFVGMFSKAVVSVFSSSVSGDVGANLGRWEVWIFLLLLPTALGCQVTFLNSALKRFDAKEAVPLYQSMVVVCGVVFGWTIFNESAGKSGGAIAGFISGIMLIVVGILCLLLKKQPPRPESTQLVLDKLFANEEIQLATVKRSKSAPPSLRPRRTLDDRARRQFCQQCSLQELEMRVPLYWGGSVTVGCVHLVSEDCAQAVSPSFLLKPPRRGRRGSMEAPGRAAAPMRAQVVLPASRTVFSCRAQDRKYRLTTAVAGVTRYMTSEDVAQDSFLRDAFETSFVDIVPIPLMVLPAPRARRLIERPAQMQRSLRNLLAPLPTELRQRKSRVVVAKLQSFDSCNSSLKGTAEEEENKITRAVSLSGGVETLTHRPRRDPIKRSVTADTLYRTTAPIPVVSHLPAIPPSPRAAPAGGVRSDDVAVQMPPPQAATRGVVGPLPPLLLVPLGILQHAPIDTCLLSALVRWKHIPISSNTATGDVPRLYLQKPSDEPQREASGGGSAGAGVGAGRTPFETILATGGADPIEMLVNVESKAAVYSRNHVEYHVPSAAGTQLTPGPISSAPTRSLSRVAPGPNSPSEAVASPPVAAATANTSIVIVPAE